LGSLVELAGIEPATS